MMLAGIQGIHPIVPTPFDERGALDVYSIGTLTEFMIRCDVDGLVILGIMGEADRLTDRERDRVVELFRQVLPQDRVLIVGAGAAGTDAAIQACERALEMGADALLVGPPRIQNDAVLFSYYERIAQKVSAPIIVHDYPAVTGVILSPALLARLHEELERVQYVKLEDPPTGPKMECVRSLAGERFGIFGGLGGVFALEELERGAVGIMTGFAYPELLVRLYRLYRMGDLSGAAELFYGILPLIRFEFQPALGVSIRKTLLVRRGAIRTAMVRHPGAIADTMTLAQLDRIIDHLTGRGYLKATAARR